MVIKKSFIIRVLKKSTVNCYIAYLKFYPEKCFQIPTLFYTSYEECTKEHAARLQGLEPTDQLYLYPEAKNGKPWQIYDSFEAFSFSIELAGLRKSINLVWNQIDSQ